MVLTENLTYNGDLIHTRFAYKHLRDNVSPIGDIICFRGSMNVTTNLIDQEDLLNKDYIYSSDAVNFLKWSFCFLLFLRLSKTTSSSKYQS